MAGRGELTEEAWGVIAPLLPAGGHRGGQWRDHRTVSNGILWKLRTGAPWRDVPERYGPWQTCAERLYRWRRDGTWDRILAHAQTRSDAVGEVVWEVSIDSTTASVRFAITRLSIFAAIAWLLAVVGVYAIVSYLVSERMHEMGVRVALGARPVNLVSLVCTAGMRFIAIGVATGLILLLALSRLLQHFMYGVRVVDPITYLVMALLVLIAAGLAMLVPARKAVRADPMTVLRTD